MGDKCLLSLHYCGQSKPNVFVRYMILNLASVEYWQLITLAKQQQADIDNVSEKARQIKHYYAIVDQFYAEMAFTFYRLEYKKKVLCRITEVFTNGTVRFQQNK